MSQVFSDRYFHTVCLGLVCLPFLREQHSAPLWPLSHPALLTLKTPGFRDVVWAALVLVFWRKGPHTGIEASLTQRGGPGRAQGSGPCCRQARQPVSCSWLCVYVEGQGREMAPASSFVAGERCLNAAFQGSAPRRANSLSHCVTQPFLKFFPHHLFLGCCLISLQE